MQCADCHIEHDPGDLLEGDVCLRCTIIAVVHEAAEKLGMTPDEVNMALANVPRRARTRAQVETFEERNQRLRAPFGSNRSRTLAKTEEASIRLDKAVDTPVQINGGTECPVCMRLVRGGRADRVTCSDHCRDLARRIRQQDPRAQAALTMLFDPPKCAGCHEPLWAMRPDARVHNATCRKRQQRSEAA